MTLKEAKDQVAKKYGADSWWSLDFAALPQEALRDEAAELYARSKWDQACETVNRMQSGGVYQTKPEFK